MSDGFIYKLTSGKPIKFLYYLSKSAGLAIPNAFYRMRLNGLLAKAKKRPDYGYLKERVDYYMKINEPFHVADKDKGVRNSGWYFYTGPMDGFKLKTFHSAYFFDQHDVTRWFPTRLRWNYCPGDVYFNMEEPTMVKSRLLTGDNTNSIILKLDKLRHFMFVHDRTPFRQKKDMAIYRGKIRQSRVRTTFLKKFFGHPMFDCGVVGRNEGCPEEWMSPKKTISEHLEYKFIMSLEGNDVASNLKWVMSSNSLAVMTRPTCETWFMEGKLKAGYHYVEVKEDFSDLEEKLQYYIDNPDKAEEIIAHAHEFVSQFLDKKRENLLQLMVMDKFLRLSGQR